MNGVMKTAACACLMTAGLSGWPARADFKLQPGTPAEAPATDVSPAPGPETAQAPEPAKPRFKLAEGFGQGVPLGFAARQIVPKAVTVTFGPNVDEDSPIDWVGGKGWNRVLAEAVKPLGLHLTTGTTTVLISR